MRSVLMLLPPYFFQGQLDGARRSLRRGPAGKSRRSDALQPARLRRRTVEAGLRGQLEQHALARQFAQQFLCEHDVRHGVEDDAEAPEPSGETVRAETAVAEGVDPREIVQPPCADRDLRAQPPQTVGEQLADAPEADDQTRRAAGASRPSRPSLPQWRPPPSARRCAPPAPRARGSRSASGRIPPQPRGRRSSRRRRRGAAPDAAARTIRRAGQRCGGAVEIFPARERHGQHDAVGLRRFLQRRVLHAEGGESPARPHRMTVLREQTREQRHAPVPAEHGDGCFP